MSQDPRPPKRTRTEDSGEDAAEHLETGLKRSEEFWLEDGNIVLIAGETAFRVYRGLLALQSTVFADLFASSSPNAGERYEDCPVIRLTDSPQDLVHVLRALLPTSGASYVQFSLLSDSFHTYASRVIISLYRSNGDPPMSVHQISAIVRLAHKYHIEGLLRQALSALQDTAPSSFKLFDHGLSVLPVKITTPGQEAIAVTNLARLTETNAILPLNLYACCGLGPALLDGWEREDGTTEYLSVADLKRCISGREVLAKEAFAFVSVVFEPEPSDSCTSSRKCQDALRRTLADALDLDTVAEPYVLENWAPFIRDHGLAGDAAGYCYACQCELIDRDVSERRRIWDRLPQIFDVEVPNWNQDPVHGDR